MQKTVFFLLITLSVSLQAQETGALAKMDKILLQAARAQKSAALPRPNTRAIFPPPTPHYKQFASMEHALQHRIAISNKHQLNLVNYDLHPQADTRKYQQVMKNFLTFKQQADPFLYYQVKDKRRLEPEEKRQWLLRIYEQKRQLASLRTIVSVQEKSLQKAYQYLNEVLHAVAPDVALLSVPQPYQQRQDRTYTDKEFFLHPPQNNLFIRALHQVGLLADTIKPLPKDLNIAVFNDNFFYINELKFRQKEGKLFPTQHVLFSSDAYELLRLIDKRIFVPDVIITDICSNTGPGGVCLTQELRNGGYNGIILALTAFEEKEISGDLFMAYGFDGMICGRNILVTPNLVQALQNYFYYRNVHGWIR